ncbi:MAG: type II toxin-antitoxin system VapC family toxin [Polyangiaceae bacterium]
MILVDTNAWVRHLRQADTRLVQLLLEGRVRTCDVVIGGLLLGAGLPAGFAADMMALPRIPTPPPAGTRAFVERHRRSFGGSGVGWADAQILHAANQAGTRIYTSDGPVRRVCRALKLQLA